MEERKMIICPHCDGLGEWDEGPINTHGGWCDPADPIYRQVKCEECDGLGRIPKTVYFAVATLNEPTAEPYAVLRIDTDKRAGNGCEAVVDSLHWSRDVAEAIAEQLNRTFDREAHRA